ncbi:MAG: hypothetical protein RL033_2567 [Pseudomonadota bacterium]|jgi:uncharacterized protein YkwD
MLGSVTRLGWDGCLAWALGLSLVASLLVSACANEVEVTTEYVDEEGAEPFLPGASFSPDAADSTLRADGDPEPGGGTEEAKPSPASGGMGVPMASAPDSDGAQTPIALAGAEQVPSSAHCAAVSDWDPLWVQFEEEVLLLVNEARSEPADCGEEGVFPAAGPLVMDPVLRCSARLHSLDMFERHFFNHTNPDGKDPFERMAAAGFHGSGAAENIAVGQTSPAQVTQSWMDSDGHCSNVMRRSYTMLGVGYHPGLGKRGLGSNFWTENFGAPPRSCVRNCR